MVISFPKTSFPDLRSYKDDVFVYSLIKILILNYFFGILTTGAPSIAFASCSARLSKASTIYFTNG